MVEIDYVDYKEEREHLPTEPDINVWGGDFIFLREGNISGTYDDREEYVDEDIIREEIELSIEDTYGREALRDLELEVYDYELTNPFSAKFTAVIRIEREE